MGSTYTNVTLKGAPREEVLAWLREAGRSARISPAGESDEGAFVVYDEECERRLDVHSIERFGAELSSRFACAALSVLVFDEDVLVYHLHRSGDLIDYYNSWPQYFEYEKEEGPPEGGEAIILRDTLAPSLDPARLSVLLHGPQGDFASETHEALVHALGLPACAVSFGFDALSGGELPEGCDAAGFDVTGGGGDPTDGPAS